MSEIGAVVGEAPPDASVPWPPAFEEFYVARYAQMYAVATLVTGRHDVSEDVVQDSFVALAGRWDDVEQPLAYLRRTVVNGCYRAARRARRDLERAAAERVDVVPPPEASDAWRYLARLSARRRTAVVLKYWGDWPDAEIAAALNCRPATVRSLLHRALIQLRGELS
jgi:RNA polymerase sigma factor (sigma-70 family)